MKMKITLYLWAFAVLSLIAGCTKQSDIKYIELNKTYTYNKNIEETLDSIDIDKNGSFDIIIQQFAGVLTTDPPIDTLFQFVVIKGVDMVAETKKSNTSAGDFIVARALKDKEEVSRLTGTWGADILLGYTSKVMSTGVGIGSYNMTDAYVGISFKISGEIHNGWMLVSTSTDATILSIKEIAYNTIANVPIVAGAKK